MILKLHMSLLSLILLSTSVNAQALNVEEWKTKCLQSQQQCIGARSTALMAVLEAEENRDAVDALRTIIENDPYMIYTHADQEAILDGYTEQARLRYDLGKQRQSDANLIAVYADRSYTLALAQLEGGNEAGASSLFQDAATRYKRAWELYENAKKHFVGAMVNGIWEYGAAYYASLANSGYSYLIMMLESQVNYL